MGILCIHGSLRLIKAGGMEDWVSIIEGMVLVSVAHPVAPLNPKP